MWKALADEFQKLAAVSADQANSALTRLKKLEESKPTGGEIARGAVAGASLGALGNVMGSTIAGTRAPLRALAAGGPTLGRQVAGSLAPGVLIGAALPILRRKMDEGAEVETLKNHLGMSQKGPVRSRVKQTLGVG